MSFKYAKLSEELKKNSDAERFAGGDEYVTTQYIIKIKQQKRMETKRN